MEQLQTAAYDARYIKMKELLSFCKEGERCCRLVSLAVDIGASSGRHIVGTVQDGRIVLQEVYRFENGVRRKDGHLCWDIDTLAREVINGLRAAHDAGFAPATIGIDMGGGFRSAG